MNDCSLAQMCLQIDNVQIVWQKVSHPPTPPSIVFGLQTCPVLIETSALGLHNCPVIFESFAFGLKICPPIRTPRIRAPCDGFVFGLESLWAVRLPSCIQKSFYFGLRRLPPPCSWKLTACGLKSCPAAFDSFALGLKNRPLLFRHHACRRVRLVSLCDSEAFSAPRLKFEHTPFAFDRCACNDVQAHGA